MDEHTELNPPSVETIEGRQLVLSNGAIVWGAPYKGSTVWKFTSKAGAGTFIKLSREAIEAMVQLFQGMIGCDEDFAAVKFESPSDSANPQLSSTEEK